MFRSRLFPFMLLVLIVLSIQPVLTLPAQANPPEADRYAQQTIDQSRAERITPARHGLTDRAIEATATGLQATTVAASGSHTCAITNVGGVYCWGYNNLGQLGDGTTTDRQTPVAVVGLSSGVRAIAATGSRSRGFSSRTCALTSAGGVYCWGSGVLTPVAVAGLSSGVQAIAVGTSHTCVVTSSGGVSCWGSNSYGQLGDGTKEYRPTPVAVASLNSDVKTIAAGSDHTCAVTNAGAVYCWGSNGQGQLGDGTKENRLTPVAVASLNSGMKAIAAGRSHTCALTNAGTVSCWGASLLGDGTYEQRLTPVAVEGLSNDVMAIAAGDSHTCALTSMGEMSCWGSNGDGQIGDGTLISRQTPVAVTGLNSDVTAIAAGWDHTCAVTSAGGVRCWGLNDAGQLGDGTAGFSQISAAVLGMSSGMQAVAAGGDHGAYNAHTCVLSNAGGVYCWGSNGSGQLGDGTTTDRRIPVAVIGLDSGVRAITAGTKHTCALTSAGGVYCWGDNQWGQLGDGTYEQYLTPVAVVGLSSGVRAIAAGGGNDATGSFTCAVTDAGTVSCWGDTNDWVWNGSPTPVKVEGLGSDIQTIAAGNDHACAVDSANVLYCWGTNTIGQLGDGSSNPKTTPVEVKDLDNVIAVAAGGTDNYYQDYDSHTCAITSAGGVYCWGGNGDAQLGDGTFSYSRTPVAAVGLNSDIRTIAAAGLYTCAVTTAGGVYCWGSRLSSSDRTPAEVAGLSSGVSAIDVGSNHACAVTDAGGVRCWGSNRVGHLGDGTIGRMPFPVAVIGFGQAYTISGRITDSNNTPLADVIISDGAHMTATDSNGNYTVHNVPDGSYTLTPSKIGYRFTPASRNVTVAGDVSGQDFIASVQTTNYNISGHVLDTNSNGVSGVTLSDGVHTVTTASNGDYTLSNVPAGVYTLTPSKIGYRFTPATRTVTVASNVSGQDFTVAADFDVGRDGFSFANFNYTKPDGANWEHFKKTFPGTQMELPTGERRKGPESYFNSSMYQAIGAGGNCAGFTAASLIHFLDLAETVEPDLLSAANRTINMAHNFPGGVAGNVTPGQSDVKDYLHLYQARQASAAFLRWWNGSWAYSNGSWQVENAHYEDTPVQTYQAIKSSTQEGVPLAVDIHSANQGHRMTAYRTEEIGNTGHIYVYDNNWPDDATRRIEVNLATGQWSYVLSPYTTWNGTTGLYYAPASLNFPAELFGQFSSAAELSSSQTDDGTMLGVDGDASLLIQDAQGRQSGYKDGNLVNEIPGVSPIYTMGYNPDDPDAQNVTGFYLPPTMPYTVSIQATGNTGSYSVMAFGAGSAMRLDDIAISASTADQLVLEANTLHTRFTPATDSEYCQYITREASPTTSRDFTACVTTSTAGAIEFDLDAAGNELTVANRGTGAVSLTSTINQVGTDASSSSVDKTIVPGTAVTISASSGSIYLPLVIR